MLRTENRTEVSAGDQQQSGGWCPATDPGGTGGGGGGFALHPASRRGMPRRALGAREMGSRKGGRANEARRCERAVHTSPRRKTTGSLRGPTPAWAGRSRCRWPWRFPGLPRPRRRQQRRPGPQSSATARRASRSAQSGVEAAGSSECTSRTARGNPRVEAEADLSELLLQPERGTRGRLGLRRGGGRLGQKAAAVPSRARRSLRSGAWRPGLLIVLVFPRLRQKM